MYSKLTNAQLTECLKSKNIEGRSKLKKKEHMIAVLECYDANPCDKLSIQSLIQKISQVSIHPVSASSPLNFIHLVSAAPSPLSIPPSVETIKPVKIVSMQSLEQDIKRENLLKFADQLIMDMDSRVSRMQPEEKINLPAPQPAPQPAPSQTVRLEMSQSDFERLVKIVNSHEKMRMKSREISQKKSINKLEQKNAKFVEAGLHEFVKTSRIKEEPLVKPMNLHKFVINL